MITDGATAAAWVFAVLLAVAGARKITQPAATGAALHGAHLPSDHRLVRLLGAGEIGVGAAVLAVGGMIPAALLALAYAVFAAFAWRQARNGAGCGCFGAPTTPATTLHVVVNVAAAVGAAFAAAADAPSVLAAAQGDLALAVPTLVLLAAAASALRLALTALPDLAAAAALVAPKPETSS